MKGLILGKSTILSKEVRYKEEKNILFIAPTKTGYESKILIPNLIKNNVNIIVFDKKQYLLEDTGNIRQEKGFITHLLKISNETRIEDIKDFYKEKFTIYIDLERILIESDESKKEILIKNLINVMDYIFGKIKEKNIECLSFINDYIQLLSLILPFNKNLDDYLCKNNKMIYQIYCKEQIFAINENLKTNIDINNFTIFSTVKQGTRELLKELRYKNKKIIFFQAVKRKENIEII